MGIQEIFDKICEGEMYKRVATGQNMSLGELIDELDGVDHKCLAVRLEDGRGISGIESYRGYYSDLALVPSETPIGARQPEYTVENLLDGLKNAVGEKFTGYKGGEFVMQNHTPVWVSEYGEASGLAVKGVEVRDDKVVILTEQVD
jgi:hypothetical protein